jgi:hypothetical protein
VYIFLPKTAKKITTKRVLRKIVILSQIIGMRRRRRRIILIRNNRGLKLEVSPQELNCRER